MRTTIYLRHMPHLPDTIRALPLDGDEDGAYAALKITPCALGGCGALLCACCAQFACDGCDGRFCLEHRILVPDGTPSGLACCPTCATDCEPFESPISCHTTGE